MKPFIGIFLVLLISLMINCSKSNPGVSIAGTWTGVSSTSAGCTSSTSNVSVTLTCPATANTLCIKLTLSSGGTYSTEFSYYSSTGSTSSTTTGTYTINGNQITVTPTSSGGGTTTPETDTFVLSSNTLTITSPKSTSTGCTSTIVLKR